MRSNIGEIPPLDEFDISLRDFSHVGEELNFIENVPRSNSDDVDDDDVEDEEVSSSDSDDSDDDDVEDKEVSSSSGDPKTQEDTSANDYIRSD